MTITRDGDIKKEIVTRFCHETRGPEYDLYLNGQYIGTARSVYEAHERLDRLAYEQLRRAS